MLDPLYSAIVRQRRSVLFGSSRFVSTSSRTMYSDTAYAPFGEPYAQAGATDLSFTGQNQDTVSNLYDFPAREYGIQSRWPSPDPAGLAAVDTTNPQSWNRYAYVLNSPLNYVDPSGLDGIAACPPKYATYCNYGNHSYGVSYYWDWGRAWDPFDLLFPTGCSESGCVTTIDPNAFNLLGLLNTSGGSPCLAGVGPLQPGQSRCTSRNCTVSPATARQYVTATGQVVAMTAEFFSGLGPGNPTFTPTSATSQVVAQSAGVEVGSPGTELEFAL